MKISKSFYIRSWMKNSLMALGTGLFIGYFTSVIIVIYAPPINALVGAVLSLAIYQYVSYDRFFGSRRGELASSDPYLISDSLKKYIKSQIERIELKGPKKGLPALGAKYQAW